ncbi:hypothetical protein X992_5648 [Burkholderia pseudomallei MSHR5492]|nr:hypothetical protein X992_5648 [Burkholderia pseudomallei MSHR5492]
MSGRTSWNTLSGSNSCRSCQPFTYTKPLKSALRRTYFASAGSSRSVPPTMLRRRSR